MPDTARLPSLAPDIRLFGPVDQDMLSEFFRQQAEAPSDKPLLVELSTQGGDADIARRIAQELRLWQSQHGREVWFLGKSYVYSAGVTILAAVPRQRRFLTADTELLIHERRLKKVLRLYGPLSVCATQLRTVMAEVESGQRLERDGFAELVKGSQISLDDVMKKVQHTDWYVHAPEALARGLVAGMI